MEEIYDTLAPVFYNVNVAAIAKLKKEFMPLVVTDISDKEQVDVVHSARMVMVKVRTSIETERKLQKAAALAHGKKVDAAARVLFDESDPVEEHLKSQEDKVIKEKERIEAEARQAEQIKIQARIDTLMEYSVVLPFMEVATWTDEEYNAKLAVFVATWEEEQERLVREATTRIEDERVMEEKQVELDRVAKEQANKETALRDERESFEREKREAEEKKNREAFEIKAKEEAKIKAEQDVKEKIEREALEIKEREHAEKAEAERQETLKPDKEKLINYAIGLTAIIGPDVTDAKAHKIIVDAEAVLAELAETIINQAEVM